MKDGIYEIHWVPASLSEHGRPYVRVVFARRRHEDQPAFIDQVHTDFSNPRHFFEITRKIMSHYTKSETSGYAVKLFLTSKTHSKFLITERDLAEYFKEDDHQEAMYL